MEKKVKTEKTENVAKKTTKKVAKNVAEKMTAEQKAAALKILKDANKNGYELSQKLGPMIPEGENLIVVLIALQYMFANVLSMGGINDEEARSILTEFIENVYALNHTRIELAKRAENNKKSPEDKLMNAIFGKKTKS